MGSDGSHYLWRTKSQDRAVHKLQHFWREGRAEAESSRDPSAYQPNALPLGHTGWRPNGWSSHTHNTTPNTHTPHHTTHTFVFDGVLRYVSQKSDICLLFHSYSTSTTTERLALVSLKWRWLTRPSRGNNKPSAETVDGVFRLCHNGWFYLHLLAKSWKGWAFFRKTYFWRWNAF